MKKTTETAGDAQRNSWNCLSGKSPNINLHASRKALLLCAEHNFHGGKHAVCRIISTEIRDFPPWKNLNQEVVDFFKAEADETGIPYQILINSYLLDCVKENRHLDMKWT